MRTPTLLALTCSLLISPFALSQNNCALTDLNPVALDKNKNGAISRDEAADSVLAWSFDQVDSNKDGIIDQPEFAQRCNPQAQAQAANTARTSTAKAEPNALEKVATEKTDRQVQRQSNKAESRVDQETDKAVDKAVNRGLDRLFGR